MPTIVLPVGTLNIKGPQSPFVWVLAGALTFAGLAPTAAVTSGTTVTPGVGAITYAGLAPTVRTGDQVFDLPAGQLVIKGPARPQLLPQLGVGSLRYTGTVTGVQVDAPGSAVSIPAGVLVYTGRAPDRLNDFTLAVPVGSLAITGRYVGILFTQPAAGSLVYQGLAPSVAAAAATITVGDGREVFQGIAPAVQLALTIDVPVGSLVATGLRPNLSTPFSLVVPTGTLALTGQAPTVDWTTGLSAGGLVFTSVAPMADLATGEPAIPVGALVWQGYACDPVFSNGTIITSQVSIARSVSAVRTITRTVTSEVQR